MALALALLASPASAMQQCYVDYLAFRMIWPGSPQLSVFVDDFDRAAGVARVGTQNGLWQICGGRAYPSTDGQRLTAEARVRAWEGADLRPPGALVAAREVETVTLEKGYAVAMMRAAYQVTGSDYRRTRFHLVVAAPDGLATGGEMSCTVTTNTRNPNAARFQAELEAILHTIHIDPIPGVPACLR